MIKATQLVDQNELSTLFYETWYDPFFKFYRSSYYSSAPFFNNENNEHIHSFASIDLQSGQILGCISYHIDWASKSVCNLALISFKKYSYIFAKDAFEVIKDIFFKYNMNRLAWWSYADNPNVSTYKRLIKKYGGVESGYERQSSMLDDGKLHDVINFEVLRSDLKITE